MNEARGFQGRIVLVVGATGGIGGACARAFAAAGASLAIADLDDARTRALASDLASAAADPADAAVSAHTVDLAVEGSAASLVAQVEDAHGGLDIVVSAAGYLKPEPLLELSMDEWDRTHAVNIRGNVFLAQAAARSMVRRQVPGRVVLIASMLSRMARLNNVAYAASKAALVQAVRCMALELAPYRITVNAVSPGSTATPMLLENQMQGSAAALHDVVHGDLGTWRLGIPLGRLAEPADQAAAVLFLASDAAAHITGHELHVDGGQSVV